MSESTKGKRPTLVVDGREVPYDRKITVYVDLKTGSWVVRTSMTPEITTTFLKETVEHFELMTSEETESLPEPEKVLCGWWTPPPLDFH